MSYAPVVLQGDDGTNGTNGSDVTTAARSGTPASPPKRSRIGDLRMRDVYRGLAVLAAAAVVAAGLVFVLPSSPDEVAAGPITAPPAQPSSSGATPPPQQTPTPSVLGTTAAPEVTAPSAVASTTLTPSPLAATGRPIPTPGTTLAPGYTAMEALYADARVPRLPAKARRVPLKAAAGRTVKDRRSGVVVPRLAKPGRRTARPRSPAARCCPRCAARGCAACS